MGSGLGRQTNSPADTEGEAANVGDDVVEPMVDTPPVLEVDIELSEFQLHVINIMQEEHEDAHVVVPTGKGNRETWTTRSASAHSTHRPPHHKQQGSVNSTERGLGRHSVAAGCRAGLHYATVCEHWDCCGSAGLEVGRICAGPG